MISARQASFANSQRVAHLATTDAAGKPHVVPVCFTLLDGVFYFVIDRKPKLTTNLKRLRNIERNPNVALIIDRYAEDWARLGWMMVHGTASVLQSHDAAIAALREKYPQYREMTLDDRPVVKIAPDRVLTWGDLA